MSGVTGRAILAGDAAVRFRADRKRFKKDIELVKADLRSFNLAVGKIGTGLAAAGAAVTGSFILPVREFSRIEQLLGRFSAVFRDLEENAGSFADSLATKINQSGLDIRDQLAQFQSVLLGLGASPGQALGLSKQLAIYSQDLVAFDDTITNTQEATDKFLSAIAGEVRPARRIGGADIRQSALDAYLLSEGMAASANEATELQRVLARLAIVFESVKRSGIAGQAEREVETLASLFRAFKARVVEVNFAIGKGLQPQIQELTKTVNTSLDRFEKFVITNRELVPLIAKLGVQSLGAGVALKASSVAAGVVANGYGAIATAASRLTTLGPAGLVTTAVVGGGALLIATSDDIRDAFADAFEGIQERALEAVGIITSLLEEKRWTEAIQTLSLAIQRELLRVFIELEQEVPAVYIALATLETQLRLLWKVGMLVVQVFNDLVLGLANVSDILGAGNNDQANQVMKQRLESVEALLRLKREELELAKKLEEQEAQQKTKAKEVGKPNRRIRDGEIDIVFGDTKTRQGAIAGAAASLSGSFDTVFRANAEFLNREFDKIFGKGSRFVAVLRQNARIQRGERLDEIQEERAGLKQQVKAIKQAFSGEAASSFGGPATRLAFGIGESKVDEEQLAELKEINERLQALIDEEIVLAAAGT